MSFSQLTEYINNAGPVEIGILVGSLGVAAVLFRYREIGSLFASVLRQAIVNGITGTSR